MKCKLLLVFISVVGLSGCSFLAYTPVVVSASLGLNKEDLSEKPEYKDVVGRPFSLAPLDDVPWLLKKFSGGRHHIERQSNIANKITVCDLTDARLVIDEIFFDSINGGVFYSAVVECAGKSYEAPLNHWSESIRVSMDFIER